MFFFKKKQDMSILLDHIWEAGLQYYDNLDRLDFTHSFMMGGAQRMEFQCKVTCKVVSFTNPNKDLCDPYLSTLIEEGIVRIKYSKYTGALTWEYASPNFDDFDVRYLHYKIYRGNFLITEPFDDMLTPCFKLVFQENPLWPCQEDCKYHDLHKPQPYYSTQEEWTATNKHWFKIPRYKYKRNNQQNPTPYLDEQERSKWLDLRSTYVPKYFPLEI